MNPFFNLFSADTFSVSFINANCLRFTFIIEKNSAAFREKSNTFSTLKKKQQDLSLSGP